MSDWKYAFIAAFILLGIAAFVVFVIHPGGFEGQIGWFFGLLPGAFVAATVGHRWAGMTPLWSFIAFWPLILCTSFLWYFAISYAVIKTYRLASSHFKRR